MRAKMRIASITLWDGGETLSLNAVARNEGYPADGADEDNTYARWTPAADLKISIQNPNLFGKFSVGQTFYIDFTEVKGSGE